MSPPISGSDRRPWPERLDKDYQFNPAIARFAHLRVHSVFPIG